MLHLVTRMIQHITRIFLHSFKSSCAYIKRTN